MNRKRFIQVVAGSLTGTALCDGFSFAQTASAQQKTLPKPKSDDTFTRFDSRINAALGFLSTLNAEQKEHFYLPVVNDSVGPSGRGIRVAMLTDSAQKKALAHLIRTTEPFNPIFLASESDSYIASLPMALYLTLTGSVTVSSRNASVTGNALKLTQVGGQVRLFDFGSGQAAPVPSAIPNHTAGAFSKKPSDASVYRNGVTSKWWMERLRIAAKQIRQKPYPAHLPVPETAFLNSASADYAALPLDAQRWIRAQVHQIGGIPDAVSFDWNGAVVSFSQTLAFNGVLTEEREQFPTLKNYGGFEYQLA